MKNLHITGGVYQKYLLDNKLAKKCYRHYDCAVMPADGGVRCDDDNCLCRKGNPNIRSRNKA